MKIILGGLLAFVLAAGPAFAQEPASTKPVLSLRQAIKATRIEAPAAQSGRVQPAARSVSRSSPNVAKRIAVAGAAATGGFFGGGFLGAKIENTWWNCGCDDPGLRGFLIGAPIGAIVGGVLGFTLSR